MGLVQGQQVLKPGGVEVDVLLDLVRVRVRVRVGVRVRVRVRVKVRVGVRPLQRLLTLSLPPPSRIAAQK